MYVNDDEYRQVFSTSKRLHLVSDPKEADIVLITNERTLSRVFAQNQTSVIGKKPILFVTDYHLLDRSEEIVGAFYWRKGRSQLLFVKNRLDKYNITLPDEYQRFTVDEL